jgi:hypothetical protein
MTVQGEMSEEKQTNIHHHPRSHLTNTRGGGDAK